MLKVSNGKAAPIFVNFRMYGGQYRVPTKKRLKEEEFYQYLLFARRMIGYVVAPKFALARIFMSEEVDDCYEVCSFWWKEVAPCQSQKGGSK